MRPEPRDDPESSGWRPIDPVRPDRVAAGDTHLHRARERVRAERDAFAAKVDAYEAFADRVAEIGTEMPTAAPGVAVSGGGRRAGTPSTPDRCRRVRTAFDETVRPHSVADIDEPEPLTETLRAELPGTVAAALAPATETTFSPAVKRGVLGAVEARTGETETVLAALDREADGLSSAVALVEAATAWIAEAEETPLSEVGFDPLARRHRRLAGFEDRCEELASERQSTLAATTNQTPDAGVRHRDLVAFCYDELPVDYPVLSTVARLAETCRSCRRAVRTHLVRRA
ncbi:hypothetical protein HZS55_07895 [Halosimplex rubrum]|uniref:DUF7260 domain-containing protein n=1 Tax=Halosimplex rubrum TaxID=869889 RepID=A0A7D5NZY6_9EURY|nr:hypothetical protein [Halosimplex rubrum]QLH77217.1 hypothetical protein HZS55_07895 [Halosimplex rubrum]